MSVKNLVPIELPADPATALEAATKQYVDNKAATGVTGPRARMYRTADQTGIAANVGTPIDWTATDYATPASFADLTNNQLLIPEDGVYIVTAHAAVTTNTNYGFRHVDIRRNGVQIRRSRTHPSGGNAYVVATVTREFLAGDVITSYFEHTSTGTVDLLSGTSNTALEAAKVVGGSPTPIGSMMDWDSGAALPTGYLWCDGATVSRTTYAALFSVISTRFNTGYPAAEAGTDFRLPLYLKQFADRDFVSPFTAATGFSVASGEARLRSGIVFASVTITRTGTTVTNANVDYGNLTIANLDGNLAPDVASAMSTRGNLRVYLMGTGGALQTTAGMADSAYTHSNMVQNEILHPTGSWPLPQSSTFPSIRKIIRYA